MIERDIAAKEKLDRRSESPVLYGLKPIYSPFTIAPEVNLADILLSKIVEGRIKPLAIVGPPGLGKTTTAFELNKELNFLTNNQYGLSMHFFDTSFRETEKTIGPRAQYAILGTENEFWDQVNKKIFTNFKKNTAKSKRRYPLEIKTIELPLCGEQDRGVSALSKLFRQPAASLVIGFIPENTDSELSKTQTKAGRLRSLVANSEPENVIKTLSQFGVNITIPDDKDITEMGLQIKSIFSRMAEEERIKALNDEMIREISFMSVDINYIKKNILPEKYHTSPFALHMAYTILRKARVSESNFMLVVNPYLEDTNVNISLNFLTTSG